MSKAMKIAIVDDEKDMRQSISQWLALSGFDTETFASAEDALKVIGADYPGILVADVKMPGMDGMQLLRKVKSLDSTLPVIMITGHGDVKTAVEAMKKGAADFLPKPFSLDHLDTVLRKALELLELLAGLDALAGLDGVDPAGLKQLLREGSEKATAEQDAEHLAAGRPG